MQLISHGLNVFLTNIPDPRDTRIRRISGTPAPLEPWWNPSRSASPACWTPDPRKSHFYMVRQQQHIHKYWRYINIHTHAYSTHISKAWNVNNGIFLALRIRSTSPMKGKHRARTLENQCNLHSTSLLSPCRLFFLKRVKAILRVYTSTYRLAVDVLTFVQWNFSSSSTLGGKIGKRLLSLLMHGYAE